MDQQCCFLEDSLGGKSLFEILTFWLFPKIETNFLIFANRQREPYFFQVIITIEFMFAGINMFWARLRPILNESEKGPKHIYAQEHKLYYY